MHDYYYDNWYLTIYNVEKHPEKYVVGGCIVCMMGKYF